MKIARQSRVAEISRFLGASERTSNGFRLVLPLPPNKANTRYSHWSKEYGKRKAYMGLLTDLAMDRRFPLPTGDPPERVVASVKLYVWNRMDHGNAMARLKWLEDWLVAAGYAKDDSPKHLDYTGLPEQEIDRKWQRVELELREAA